MYEVDWAAIGTWAAVVLALTIALKDGLTSRAEKRERARLASVLLWPEVRRLLTGLNALKVHPVTRKVPLFTEEQQTLTKILEVLHPDKEIVSNLVKDLSAEDARIMAVALANIRHAYRHAVDLTVSGNDYSRRKIVAKQKAIEWAIHRGRNAVVKMTKRTKAANDVASGQKLKRKKSIPHHLPKND